MYSEVGKCLGADQRIGGSIHNGRRYKRTAADERKHVHHPVSSLGMHSTFGPGEVVLGGLEIRCPRSSKGITSRRVVVV